MFQVNGFPKENDCGASAGSPSCPANARQVSHGYYLCMFQMNVIICM
jgi:hypothetical protein